MPLYSFEITEMPQVILKYFKTAPAPIEITEMPLIHFKICPRTTPLTTFSSLNQSLSKISIKPGALYSC